uniref:5-hydroxytryptamine receptor 3A-like n=1 Tax=Astyanax mexicanus TaxID=7994 RepID=A0A3B1JYV4_ASTMX
MLWKPDVSIYELAEKENGPPSPYLYITHYGDVIMEDVLTVITSCSMDVYKFPFDTQNCHMTISSMVHSNSEIKLIASSNSTRITQQSRRILKTQGEWDLLNMTVTGENMTFEPGTWDIIKYTITIRRKPLLHILNFHVPVLFFLVLDLASFFIPDNKGDKISFKVTILLAISVLLLILNEILPSKSFKCPLIATYIIFIFAFMMVSLLETILVAYLTEMDSAGEEREKNSITTRKGTSTSEKDEKRRRGSNSRTSSGVNSTSQSLAGMGLGGAGEMVDLHFLQMVVQQVQDLRENPPSLAPRAQRYYSRVAKRINTAFILFYFCSSSLFLIVISVEWMD